jgi:colanic acid biosynthesis glycosyl transferase WcaI
MSAARTDRRPRVLFLNRSYWPDAEATGQLLTELCEDLTPAFDVTVIAGQPNQNPNRTPYRMSGCEVRHGVRIQRVWNSRLSKTSRVGRVINLVSYLIGAFAAALRVSRPDIVVVETDPPLLCLLGAFLRRWHGAELVVYLQDIYPDVAIALGKMPDIWLTCRLRKAMCAAYQRAARVVVLSRDMRDLLVSCGVTPDRIECIPNWIDTSHVVPCKQENAFRLRHRLDGQFVVMYSGNLGLCQRLEDVVAAAERLRDRPDVVFLFVGDGAVRARLEETAARLQLGNVRFLPYQPKAELAQSLSAADLHLVPLDPRVSSCIMPSKLYGILASGTALLAIAPENCELARITRTSRVGSVVSPHRPDELASAIRWNADHRGQLAEMGCAARTLAVDRYDRRMLTQRFGDMLLSVLSSGSAPRKGQRNGATTSKRTDAVRSV